MKTIGALLNNEPTVSLCRGRASISSEAVHFFDGSSAGILLLDDGISFDAIPFRVIVRVSRGKEKGKKEEVSGDQIECNFVC